MKKLLIPLTLLLCCAAAQAEETLNVYFIGNSLTMSMTPDRVYNLFGQRGIDLQFGSQVSGGKSLLRHMNYHEEPGQKWKSWETNIPKGNTFTPDPEMYDDTPAPRFGLYDEALKNHKWDKVVFQIYDSSLHDDIKAISAFIDLCLTNKTCGRFYVYCPWPTRPRSPATREPLNIDYPAVWQSPYQASADDTSKQSKWNTPGRDYSHRLVDALNRKYSQLETPVRLIPTGEVIFALDAKIKSGGLPGIKQLAERNPAMLPGLDKDTDFKDGANVLYADPIHFNPAPHQGNTLGIFVSGSTMFAALSGQNPAGLSGKDYGLDDEKDKELIRTVQETVWDVLTAEPRTGITAAGRIVKAEAENRLRIQPSDIPGNWGWAPQPLPPIETITARPAPERPVYGLYCWENEYLQYHDFIKKTGWQNFRLSGPITDEVMKRYIQDEAEAMFTMAARSPFRTTGETNGRWRNRSSFNSDEAFIEAYLNDVDAVIKRYGPGGSFFKENPDLPERPLQYLEIFNEPNFWYIDTAREDSANHYPPKDPEKRKAQEISRCKLYAKLLIAAYRRVKDLAPSIQVVGMAAGGASGADVPFIEGVFTTDPLVKDSFDILSTHPYVRPAPPDGFASNSWGSVSIAGSTKAIREIMQAAGTQTRPIWWTENNWTIFPEQGGTFREAKSKDTTPDLQAAYLVRGYAWALRLGIERLHYMAVTDTDGCNAGMLNKDGSLRPAARAVQNMISLMPRPKLLGAVTENIDGIYIYRFAPDFNQEDGNEIIMAWSVTGPKPVELKDLPPEVLITDMTGGTQRSMTENGFLSLDIGPLPVYIRRAL